MQPTPRVVAAYTALLFSIFMAGHAWSAGAPVSVEEARKVIHEVSASDRDAVERAERALDAFDEAQDAAGRMDALEKLGTLYRASGDFTKALAAFRDAARTAKTEGPAERTTDNLLKSGAILTGLGRYDEALADYETALRAAPDNERTRAAHIAIGAAYADLGNVAEAINHYKAALDVNKELGDKAFEAEALLKLGPVRARSGGYGAAQECYASATRIFDELGDKNGKAGALMGAGYLAKDQGRYSQAADLFTQAFALVATPSGRGARMTLQLNMGDLYWDWGMRDRAVRWYNEALKDAKAASDTGTEAAALRRIGAVYAGQGNTRKASEKLIAARNLGLRSGESVREVEIELAGVYLDGDEPAKAEPLITRLKSDALSGRYYLLKKQYERALTHYEGLRVSAETTGKTDDMFTAYTGAGKALESLDRLEDARSAYEKAASLTEQLRAGLLPAARRNFHATRINGFSRAEPAHGLARIAYKLGTPEATLAPGELIRARAFADRLVIGPDSEYLGAPKSILQREFELTFTLALLKRLRDCCPRVLDAQRYDAFTKKIEDAEKEFDEFVEMLRREYAAYAAVKYAEAPSAQTLEAAPCPALVFDDLGEGLGVKLVEKGRVTAWKYVPRSSREIAALVDAFRKPFEEAKTSKFDLRSGKALYEMCAPVLAHVPEGSALTIVPDGALATAPFEALPTGGNLQWAAGKHGKYPKGISYLGDKYRIGYSSSLTAAALQTTAPIAHGGQRAMLVVADPVFHAKDDRWAKSDLASTPDGARTFTPMSSDSPGPDLKLERLAGAGRLASELTEMYGPETKVYTGLAARKGTVMKDIVPDLPNYTHIVFATHGMYDADLPGVLEPALALSMLPPGEDGFLRMTDVMSLKLNAQVTALTACRTGLGEFVSGEGVMSMGRAFQYAGSETVLMSLWSVEETASALLTAKFFEHLKEGKNRGDALQAARKDIRDRGYEHPFYWSAFILVGRAD